MARSLPLLLADAAEHAAAGRTEAAIAAYRLALQQADAAGAGADPVQRGVAALGLAHQALEGGSWPRVAGQELDELLSQALEAARGAKLRSRALEGQLLFVLSKALFAKPQKSSEWLEEAMKARLEAAQLMEEAAVEALPWSMTAVRSLLEDLRAKDQGTMPLSEDKLLLQLRVLGGDDDMESEASSLIDQWGDPGCDGPAMALTAFLERFLEVAGPLDREVDKEPCSAPCEGGLPDGASALEKELVALVAREGAGGWAAKAEELRGRGLDEEEVTGPRLQALWAELAPRLRKTIEADKPMACGHSCSTCPTRDDCQVHGALRDIEDL